MCGIVGGIAQRDLTPILLEGLRRLEYRGYDSAGIALVSPTGGLQRRRTLGKVQRLAEAIARNPLSGHLGIAHTRWATHGAPSERNAHPQICGGRCALVHNGIIENHEDLRAQQRAAGHRFTSTTDTEVIVHGIQDRLAEGRSLVDAVRETVPHLKGAYALGVLDARNPHQLVAVRQGSPLVVGIGFGEHFIASDLAALLPVTQRFLFLEEGDIAVLSCQEVRIYDRGGRPVQRPIRESQRLVSSVERGPYRHFMEKEIFEQPQAVSDTLEGRLSGGRVLLESFGNRAPTLFPKIESIKIVACGTSYHAGLVARYWIESLVGIPCDVEVASEYRYRKPVVPPGCLFVTISQSGETADTLAALRMAKTLAYEGTLSICNVPESTLVRESDLVLLTHAGPEIGVASTKAFTTQLVALLLLTGALDPGRSRDWGRLQALSGALKRVLDLGRAIETLAEYFVEKQHSLFLGRGEFYPIALEGALKLKEISYIHAEAYPAGELKHGPLALIDESMPVVAVAPNNALLEKLRSNLEEVRARGGELILFADDGISLPNALDRRGLRIPRTEDLLAPIAFTLPLQLLAYHVAVLRGTDVDQPRNLAKSVTVE